MNQATNSLQAEQENQIRAALDGGYFDVAEARCREFLANGGPLHVWRMLVTALRQQGRAREAREVLDMLVGHAPGDLELRFDLAEVLLLLGDFDRGWQEYRHRYGLGHTTHMDRKVQKPLWDGRSLRNKTLLIHDEQGFGDTFQFLRLLPAVKERSKARIVLQIRPEQESFAKRMPGIDRVILQGELPPAFDMHCHLMTLPMAMEMQISDLPGKIPYLAASPARMRKWQKRLANLPRPIVGLVWAGRPAHLNDANRSMTLDQLGPLGMEGMSFVSLQKGEAAKQANMPPAGMNMVNLSDEIKDFEDTAAILTVIDLLISVDSSPVHLAGALGRPAWVMLPFVPDWRWLLDRDDSPWYPSLRLFRQSRRGDWSDVLKRMAAELRKMVAS